MHLIVLVIPSFPSLLYLMGGGIGGIEVVRSPYTFTLSAYLIKTIHDYAFPETNKAVGPFLSDRNPNCNAVQFSD